MSTENQINKTELRQILLVRKAELERLSGQSEGAREAVELDQTRQGRLSRQDAMMQQEMAKETNRRRQTDMVKINAALEKIESDDYGYCINCDEPIAPARLRLDPAIITCINCASGQN